MAGPLSFLSKLIDPIAKTIDAVHTSEEEKLNAKIQLKSFEFSMMEKLMDYEREALQAKASIIMAEAQGSSWIQRSWRPVTMLAFLSMILFSYYAPVFGIVAPELPDQAWRLIQLGLGGYVVGRSAEKIAPQIADAMKTRKPSPDEEQKNNS